MAGGVSTPALAAAVSEAGGLGFLAAGYKDLDTVRADVDAVRSATARPFGINLFAPPQPVPDPAAVARYAQTLERHGALGAARHDDDGWEAKLALVAELAVPVVSFAFGCPDRGHGARAAGGGRRACGSPSPRPPRRAPPRRRAPTRWSCRASRPAGIARRSTTPRPSTSACSRRSSSWRR